MIHKTIDFSQNGGMPFNQDILQRMQNSYADISEAIAKLTGGNMILSGVISSQEGWSDGWIVYNGELLPFVASTGNYLEIIEESVSLLFGDGLQKPVFVSKYAQATSSLTSIPMNPKALLYYMGNRVTGPFKRVFDFSSVYSYFGLFYNQIKELQPIYSDRQITENRQWTYTFNIPQEIVLFENADYAEAKIYFVAENGTRSWYKDMINIVTLNFQTSKVTVFVSPNNPIPEFNPAFIEILIDIYRREQ